MPKRIIPGDVIELNARNRLIYLQYLGKHLDYGDGVRVCPRIFDSHMQIDSNLFKESYVTFYPVVASLKIGLAKIIGHLSSPGLPKRLRRPGARLGNKVETWIIEDSSGATVKQKLSEDEQQLPIAVIWNYELLVQRIFEGWRPDMEGIHE